MKHTLILLIFLTVSSWALGQKVYRADNEAYKSSKFSYEFFLLKDSTCFLKGHYPDNAIYFLYKGHLRKTSGTLYEFKFQPVVNFGCNKRFSQGDSVRFKVTQKDTTITSLTYKVKPHSSRESSIDLKSGWATVYIKGVHKEDFSINTKFIDPLTKELIFLRVDTLSEPVLTYYGSNTNFGRIQISILANKLVMYPDHEFIEEKDTFLEQ